MSETPITERDDLRPYWPGAFKVGDRVRVRLSGECRIEAGNLETGKFVKSSHDPQENGRVGTVIEWKLWLPRNWTHNIFVKFDEPYRLDDALIYHATFAATELEPLG